MNTFFLYKKKKLLKSLIKDEYNFSIQIRPNPFSNPPTVYVCMCKGTSKAFINYSYNFSV